MPPADEPDGPGMEGFKVPALNSGFDLRLEGIDTAATSVATLTANLGSLQTALGKFSTGSGNALTSLLKEIRKVADDATRSVAGLTGMGSGSSGGPSSGPSGWANQATQQASASSRMTGGIAAASSYLTGFSNPFIGAGMGALRFMRDRIGTNRNTAIEAGSQWGMVSRQQGASIQEMMGTVGKFPGGIYGTPQDLLGMFGAAPMYGASYAFGGGTTGSNGLNYGGQTAAGTGRQGVRAAGLFQGIREAQMLNPGASVGQIMSDIGGFAANTGAQQQAQMMTGGAFGMIAAGGRQKSLAEWAESVLKWLQDLRGAPRRGDPFNYGELMAQYFPGSNIDAWFQANGVPPNMRTYWWTYALAKAGSSDPKGFKITPDETNVAWQRMRATSELTRTEFNLGSAMTGAYLNKEQANKWFNQMFGQAQTSIIPALAGSGAMSWIQYLPDTIEDMLMSGVEGLAQSRNQDNGDVGDYTDTGGTGLAGLSPNMRSKLGPMMRANKRLSITSGLRDNAMQKRLKDKGYSRVSGKPSAHTRGDAADLGPPSEYGWIMKNAKKFGLKSGKSQGEPWHVGVGDMDIGEPLDFLTGGDDPMAIFSSSLGLMGGGELGTTSSSIANAMAKIMKFILGGLTGAVGAIGGPAPTFNPKLFEQLVAASYGTKIGGLPSKGGKDSGGQQSWSDFAQLPTGGGGDALGAGIAAATALYNAGFRNKSDLETITAISWRESRWNPKSKNPATSDRGLMQINMSAHAPLMAEMGYTEEDLLDIQKNANIAYRTWSKGGGNYASFKQLWGFSEHSPYNDGKPGWDGKNGDPLGRTQGSNAADVVRQANLPGIGDVATGLGETSFGQIGHAQMIPSLSRGGALMQFNNTFHINGGAGGGAGGGGVDTRRTVTLIANQLEDEMNRRLSRAN